jgi:hypothetical protein
MHKSITFFVPDVVSGPKQKKGIFDVDSNFVINGANAKKTHALAMRGDQHGFIGMEKEKKKNYLASVFCFSYALAVIQFFHSVEQKEINERKKKKVEIVKDEGRMWETLVG